MNEDQDTILLTVDVEEANVKERLIALRESYALLRKEKAANERDLKAGILTAKEFAISQQNISTNIKSVTAEIKKHEQALNSNTKQEKEATDSIKSMRASVSMLYEDWGKLTREERKNADVGGAIADQIRNLNKELDDQDKALKTGKKSVGDYIKSIDVLGINVGESLEAFKSGGQGVATFTKSILTARGAAIAFTAVPIIAILAAIIAFFKSTDEGADKLEQGIGFLTAAFDTLVKGIAPVGKLLVDLFTDLPGTLKKLVSGTDEYSVSLSGVASAAYRAGKAQADYIQTMQNVEDAENALIVKREQVGLQVDQALLKVKDRSLSEKQKIAILRDAGRAEAELSKLTLKNANDAYTAIVKLNKEKATSRDLTDDEAVAEMNAQAAVIKAQRESLNTQQSIRNRETAQIEEAAAKRKVAYEKSKQDAKDAAQDQVYLAELAVLQLKKRGEESIEVEVELTKRRATLIQKQGELEKSGLAKNSAQRKLIDAKTNAALLEQAEQQAIKLAEIVYKAKLTEIDTLLALSQAGSEKELDLRVRSINAERVKQVEAARVSIKDKVKFLDEEARINAVAARQTGDLRQAFEQAQINREAATNALRLQTQLDLGEQTIANERDVAAKRIDLEEKTQVALLDVERKYGQVSDDEYLTRLNAIQSKALAARRDLNKQIAEDERKDQEAAIDAQLARVKEGTKAELKLQLDKLKIERERALSDAKLTKAQIDAINAEFDKKEKDAEDAEAEKAIKKIQEKISKYIDVTALATSTLSTIFEAQTQSQLANLDKQQQAAVASAGANADLRAKIEAEHQKKREKLEKDAAEKRRKIASIENLIATAQAATAALTLFAKNPILGAITEALILAKAIKSQALIDAQTFAQGGTYVSDGKGAYVRGPGTAKSDSINSKLSDGESVLTAKATSLFYDQLSAMNVAGGGRPFPGAGETPMPQVSGFNMGGIRVGTDADSIAAAVIVGLKGANIAVSVREFHDVEADMTYAKATGNI